MSNTVYSGHVLIMCLRFRHSGREWSQPWSGSLVSDTWGSESVHGAASRHSSCLWPWGTSTPHQAERGYPWDARWDRWWAGDPVQSQWRSSRSLLPCTLPTTWQEHIQWQQDFDLQHVKISACVLVQIFDCWHMHTILRSVQRCIHVHDMCVCVWGGGREGEGREREKSCWPVPVWTWCGWIAAGASHWCSWYTAAQMSWSAADESI